MNVVNTCIQKHAGFKRSISPVFYLWIYSNAAVLDKSLAVNSSRMPLQHATCGRRSSSALSGYLLAPPFFQIWKPPPIIILITCVTRLHGPAFDETSLLLYSITSTFSIQQHAGFERSISPVFYLGLLTTQKPSCPSELIRPHTPSCHLRSSGCTRLQQQRATLAFAGRAFCHAAPAVWDSLVSLRLNVFFSKN
jgi:hypothetical protein